ncbi:D-amino acid dehydrogenase [Paraburkholderia strydomiana]|uniref:D-amino acid dehydrogenase n=1 Tax=Paraburkholderia strydomiana TaxID=1245417 RepID=UPI0028566A5C|nr:D-amino acid dehydrogenase [Paraburkholderia strydomiana]MDR7009640.1 D-amino-acid dehydrogenase [Paraburkholderia strydomiana]
MKVFILGAGITGITTAYFFAREGHDVTVIERHAEAGAETSFANGGQLSYSYVAPLAEPSVIGKLPSLLMDRHSPLRFKPALDPVQWRWCLAFLAACTSRASLQTTVDLLRLGVYSRQLVNEIAEAERIAFDHEHTGKLVLYRDSNGFAAARRQMEFQNAHGCEQHAVSPAECAAIEPALREQVRHLAGGIFTPSEESGDCRTFCVALAGVLKDRYGVEFLFDTSIRSFVTRRAATDSVDAVDTSRGRIDGELFVACLGAGGVRLLDLPGLRVPVYPLGGYSLTAPSVAGAAPRVSITDTHHKMVYATLGERLRIAGMVDIGPIAARSQRARVEVLRRQAEAFLPHAARYDEAEVWTGMRPATPSGKPIIGPTRYRNLWLNTGHGALGFTLACGTGALVASLALSRQQAIDVLPFALHNVTVHSHPNRVYS